MREKLEKHRDVEALYERLADVYDVLERPMEWLGVKDRRRRVLSTAWGKVLEVGVGTGKNFPFYSNDVELTGIDISPKMLLNARDRARRLKFDVNLQRVNVEYLPYPDEYFDTVVATCVFCSVNRPIRGLAEIRRVLKPDGRLLMLEHVRPDNPVMGKLFDWLNPLTRKYLGPEINRPTVANVRRAGFELDQLRSNGIWRELTARPIVRMARSQSNEGLPEKVNSA